MLTRSGFWWSLRRRTGGLDQSSCPPTGFVEVVIGDAVCGDRLGESVTVLGGEDGEVLKSGVTAALAEFLQLVRRVAHHGHNRGGNGFLLW